MRVHMSKWSFAADVELGWNFRFVRSDYMRSFFSGPWSETQQ